VPVVRPNKKPKPSNGNPGGGKSSKDKTQ
jgi:hypothetical protein